jgi:tRNA threonylcarbamoyladenosine biosynthesis protein TsaE
VIILTKEILINNLSELDALAKSLKAFLFPGFVLCLQGDLGAGKTTFTQHLGMALGIKDRINSPTFTILKIYEHDLMLYHIDAYRLQGAGHDQELEEFIYGDGLCVIEWYENIIDSIPKDYLAIHMTFIDENKRFLSIKGSGPYETIIEKLGY